MIAAADSAFDLFGTSHITVLVLAIVLPFVLSLLARRYKVLQSSFSLIISVVLVLNDLVFRVYILCTHGVDKLVSDELPIHLCGIAIYLVPIALLARRRLAFELLWFWGIAGTLHGLITPDIVHNFPDYIFLRFFIAHAGIVVAALYAVFGLKMVPGRGAVLRVFLVSNIAVIAVGVFNCFVGSNYMFLCHPPGGPTPMFFLPWPWYLLFFEATGLFCFTLLYLPFLGKIGSSVEKINIEKKQNQC